MTWLVIRSCENYTRACRLFTIILTICRRRVCPFFTGRDSNSGSRSWGTSIRPRSRLPSMVFGVVLLRELPELSLAEGRFSYPRWCVSSPVRARSTKALVSCWEQAVAAEWVLRILVVFQEFIEQFGTNRGLILSFQDGTVDYRHLHKLLRTSHITQTYFPPSGAASAVSPLLEISPSCSADVAALPPCALRSSSTGLSFLLTSPTGV